MKRIILIALAALISIGIHADSERISSKGTTNIGSITVVNSDGVETTYSTNLLGNQFSLHEDSTFRMSQSGYFSRCGDYLGKTISPIVLESVIETREYQANDFYPGTFDFIRVPVQPELTGNVEITIPAGSSVFGECTKGTLDLVELQIDSKNDVFTIRPR